MSKKLFRIYVAVSLDGFIARSDGSVDWLDEYDPAEFDFDDFLDTVGTLIIGRKTFDQAMGFGEWPYADRKTIVLTSRPLPKDAPEGTEAYAGSLIELCTRLREEPSDRGDVWIVGGSSVITQFLFGGLADRLDLFTIPIILGGGIPLFGKDAAKARPVLLDVEKFRSGVFCARYTLATSGT